MIKRLYKQFFLEKGYDQMKREGGNIDSMVSLLASVVCAVWSALWLGLAFSVLWGFFIASFFGVEKIGIAQACGLMLLLRVATFQISKINGNDRRVNQSVIECFAVTPFVASFYIFAGWVLTAWL